jgi:hypothetical protein
VLLSFPIRFFARILTRFAPFRCRYKRTTPNPFASVQLRW